MGPVIIAIEIGHIATTADKAEDGRVCTVDREPWPCSLMLEARVKQRQYAEHLKMRNAMDQFAAKVAAR